ncbi:MAG: sigma 54-interacting transcriptional regulator [Sandaracinaceae bacterium]
MEPTATLYVERGGQAALAGRFVLEDVRTGQRHRSGTPPRSTLGKDAGNDIVLHDPTVSRNHCELRVEPGGVRCRDLGSRNGTHVQGVRVNEAWLRHGDQLVVGATALTFLVDEGADTIRLSSEPRFGDLLGHSTTMRALIAQLQRAAASDATVLLRGETGSGKEVAARAVHSMSRRSAAPFVVVDVAGLHASMTEAELFGYERGAFTGADHSLPGAFERADGGTLFLDHVDELPLALQPKLLRALETRAVRRIGAIHETPLDFRVVGATRQDLRRQINQNTFRADLFYRLAVIELEVPPLRERTEDIPLLVADILDRLGVNDAQRASLIVPEQLERFSRLPWPGNVRQLRNRLERLVVLGEDMGAPESPSFTPYDAARRAALHAFEQAYVEQLLDTYDGNVTEAAKAAGMARGYLHRIIRKVRSEEE